MTPDWQVIQTRRLIRAFVTLWWRRHRCHHLDWTPLDGCPDCGKA